MGIYIPNIEMPVKGNISIYIFATGLVVSRYTGNVLTNRAVQVSPHGRLGDLDALAARFDNGKQIISSHPFPEEFKAIYSQLADEMKNEIGKCPTIIPAEEGET